MRHRPFPHFPRPVRLLLAAIPALCIGSACLAPKATRDHVSYYALGTVAAQPPGEKDGGNYEIRLHHFPEHLRQSAIATRTGDVRWHYNPHALWAEDLQSGTLRILRQAFPAAGDAGAPVIHLWIDRFDGASDTGQALIEARWQVQPPAGAAGKLHRFSASHSWSARDYESLVQALTRCLQDLLTAMQSG
jgi:uncharacterized lipoprotein YmbA